MKESNPERVRVLKNRNDLKLSVYLFTVGDDEIHALIISQFTPKAIPLTFKNSLSPP
jgi:hypothetical protein